MPQLAKKNNEKILDLELYSFIAGPAVGAIKDVKDYVMVAKVHNKVKEYFLKKKQHLTEENDEFGEFKLKRLENDYFSGSVKNIIKALLIPIAVWTLFFAISTNLVTSIKGSQSQYIIAYFLFVVGYTAISVIKIKDFESNIVEALSLDRKVITFLMVITLLYGVYGIKNPNIGYIHISTLMMIDFCLIVAIEMIKRGALILVSKNSAVWEYIIPERNTSYILISSLSPNKKV